MSELAFCVGLFPAASYYLPTHRDLQRTSRVRAFFDFVSAEIKAFRAALSGQADRPNRQIDSP